AVPIGQIPLERLRRGHRHARRAFEDRDRAPFLLVPVLIRRAHEYAERRSPPPLQDLREFHEEQEEQAVRQAAEGHRRERPPAECSLAASGYGIGTHRTAPRAASSEV